jgi:hypothetical protein
MNARTTTTVLGTLLLVSAGFHLRSALQPETPVPPCASPPPPPDSGPQLRIPEMDFSGTGLSDVSWKLPDTELPPGPGWQPAAPGALQSPTLAPEPSHSSP